MYKGIFYIIITVPMAFFVWYMWTNFPDQTTLHTVGTILMVAANLTFLAVLARNE